MGTKMAVAFANIFMSAVETEILNLSKTKRYIDDIFSLWRTERKEIDEFIALTNRYHPSIKRLTFWIQLLTKARDFTTKESLTSAHILNLQRLLNTRIFLPVTLTGSEKVLQKRAKPLDSLELTPQLNPFMRTSTTLKNAFALEVTLII